MHEIGVKARDSRPGTGDWRPETRDRGLETRNFKGQAAIEYLFTYGWAILAVIAVVAAISYLGIFSPSQFVSEQCMFQPDFPCTSFILAQKEGGLMLRFRIANGFGAPVKFVSGGGSIEEIGEAEASALGVETVLQGESKDFEIFFPGAEGLKGQVKQANVRLEYLNCGAYEDCSEAVPHSISGKIVASVE